MKYYPTIGLEIHIELKTKSKMFCSCENNPEEKRPNFNICPVCLGHPGVLPVINEKAVFQVIKTGLALNSEIQKNSRFDRKNYFYPDLPKGYQISQYEKPLCLGGYLEIPALAENNSKEGENQKTKKIRIKRIHLEEDTGRLIHLANKDYSLVDFNRAGVPLMELVTEPDLHSAKEARFFAQELQLILRYLDVSEADMEKGQMRLEANVSVSKSLKKLGTKVEIKNLNSFLVLEKAIDYEIKRQIQLLESGKEIIQETRGWDDSKVQTFSQRLKEGEEDYRYFPEPDLPPLSITSKMIEKIKAEIPELPHQKRLRLIKEYNLKKSEAEIFVNQRDLADFFERVVSEAKEWVSQKKKKVVEEKTTRIAANYILSDLQGLLQKTGLKVSSADFKITAENFGEFVSLILEDKISSKIAKKVLEEMFESGKDPSVIIEEKNLSLLSDEKDLEAAAKKVIQENEKAVRDYKAGKTESIQFLIGKLMKETQGRAEPNLAREVLTKILREI
jgi:aspartyl-tRNA(Asn)/glutamyl-tRNA(Gln) amidotransferase subunit B